jgi:DNA-binding NtrC family response regulator
MEERAIIKAALDETDGALSRTAEMLGMGRTTLWRKLKGYGLAVSMDESEGRDER